LGRAFIQNIIINSIVPVLFAFAINKNNDLLKEKALDFLIALKPEQNAVTKKWKTYNVANTNALHSQALIHLKNNYCDSKRCLNCAVGVKLLAQTMHTNKLPAG